ncbi:carbamoyltransferase, partial [Pseudomonas aeruginosa]
MKKIQLLPVENPLAPASLAAHCSGFKEKTAIIGIDGKRQSATTFFCWGEYGRTLKRREFY